MSYDVTGRWNLSQVVNGTGSMGTLSLQQQGSKISGAVEWDDYPVGYRVDHPDGSLVGAMVETTVSFSVIYSGNIVAHYAANLSNALEKMTNGVCFSNTGDSGSWEAKKTNKS